MGRPKHQARLSYQDIYLYKVETLQQGVSTIMTHLHSHVTASGGGPADVRERMRCGIILTPTSPLNSLLKIKNSAFLGNITG
jgi:hypothetical protein